MPRIDAELSDSLFEIERQHLDSSRSIVSNAEIDDRKSAVHLGHRTDRARSVPADSNTRD